MELKSPPAKTFSPFAEANKKLNDDLVGGKLRVLRFVLRIRISFLATNSRFIVVKKTTYLQMATLLLAGEVSRWS